MDSKRLRYNDANRDAIVKYLEAGGAGNEDGLALNDKQTELFNRWQFAAEKIREQKYKREQIAKFICGAFNVSRDTAFKDMVNAEDVFCASYPLNKKFLIQQRIEFLMIKINEAYIDKDAFTAAQLEKVLQKYLGEYPETAPVRTIKAVNFIVNNTQNNLIVTNLSPEQAMTAADDIAKQLEDKDDY